MTRFTQGFIAKSGLLYLRARYYDPALGCLISPDPFLGRLAEPSTQNRYVYVKNNPLGYTDPSGNAAVVIPLPGPLVVISGGMFLYGMYTLWDDVEQAGKASQNLINNNKKHWEDIDRQMQGLPPHNEVMSNQILESQQQLLGAVSQIIKDQPIGTSFSPILRGPRLKFDVPVAARLVTSFSTCPMR